MGVSGLGEKNTMAPRWYGLFCIAFHPGPTYERGAFKLAIWSALFTLFFLYVGATTFPGGAFQFIFYTTALVDSREALGSLVSNLFARDIGYPLLLLATGYSGHGSFLGVIFLQAIMAWLMPLLVYGCLGPQYRVASFTAGLATIFSLSPFLFMKMIHHDQAFIFFSLLAAYLATVYLRTSKLQFLYLAIMTLIAASLTRPAGNLLAIPLLGIFWVIRPVNWRHYLLCTAIVITCMFAYSKHRTLLFKDVPRENSRSYSGRQIFYNLYVNSAEFGVRVDESVGPATLKLFNQARALLEKKSLADLDYWYQAHGFPAAAKHYWFTQYVGDNDKFIDALTRFPSHDYFEFFCLVEPNDRVFLEAGLEIAKSNPLFVFKFLVRNISLFIWSPGYAHTRFGTTTNTFGPEGIYFMPFGADLAREQIKLFVPEPGKSELLNPDSPMVVKIRSWALPVEFIWRHSYQVFNKIAVLLSLFSLVAIFVRTSSLGTLAIVPWIFFLYQVLITCAFAEPNYRYHFFLLPTLFTLAAIGYAYLKEMNDLAREKIKTS